ncbi:hypothetical protein BDF21DRAFT_424779 [Thamnidium elegans]|uniref:Uncharacterized protein n=1 Tax=Thamnidium elegans TaxID=101142 RepID=A0A8H7SUV9_9FUNG|nr:hypothetical protein INT48_005512 [Thamnidium elegans]KAI8072048.1 hypothetical protein BDF21DRAFT_424779 [Thamnidium elegans]
MSTSTLHISISFEREPIELDILSDKLTWSNLVTLIDSMHAIDTPVTLYYKKDTEGEIEALQTQDQLAQLLIPDIKGLRFYAQKELVTKPVYILPANAFVTLTQFVDKNKSIISSSHRLARSVGMLAFFIAQDTAENKFEHEFEGLENLVTRKLNKSKCREKQQTEETGDEQDYPLESSFVGYCKFGRPDGHYFGGRGDHYFGGRGGHHFGGRGGHHFGRHGGFGGPGGLSRDNGGSFGGHGKHFGGCDGPSDIFNDRGEYFSRGGHFGRKGIIFGRGGPFGGKGKHGRGGCPSSSDTEEFGSFGKLARGFHGRYDRHEGRFSPFDKREKSSSCRNFENSSEESSSEEERRAREKYFLKKIQRGKRFALKKHRFHFT